MIIFLYGEETFLSLKKLSQLKSDFADKSTDIVVFDVAEKNLSFEKLANIIKSESLFYNNKVTVIKNIFLSEDQNFQSKIMIFFDNNIDLIKNQKIIIWEGYTPKKNNEFFKFLLRNASCEEFKKMSLYELERWIKNQFSQNKKEISSDAVKKIISSLGIDSWKIYNEIEKILNYKFNEKNIKPEDVELIIDIELDTDIFKTVEALLSGDKKTALHLLTKQLKNKTDPFYILSMYIYQCRNLLKIADLYLHKNIDYYKIAKLTKTHSFIVQKNISQLNSLNLRKIKRIYKKLEQIDEKTKLGRIDIVLALTEFVIEV